MNSSAAGQLTVRLARNEHEVILAQELRYRVFFEGMGAKPTAEVSSFKRDIDVYDEFCDHLLVLENEGQASQKVVGTYRLLRKSIAMKTLGYYSASEFSLRQLDNYIGEHLELGRSCVDPEYRGKAIMQLLWRGLAEYIVRHDISLMFGCASFPGTDFKDFSSALSFLNVYHKAPSFWRPKAQDGRFVSMNILEQDQIDVRRAMREMPALIKGYLRVGGVVGEGAVVDHEFNTTDICLLVETSNITGRYQKHFLPPAKGDELLVSA